MKESVKREFEKLEKAGWITINEHLDRDTIAAVFIKSVFTNMTVSEFMESMYPKF